jgi:hypothetical protein
MVRVLLGTLVAVSLHTLYMSCTPVSAPGVAVPVPSARAVDALRNVNGNPSEGT